MTDQFLKSAGEQAALPGVNIRGDCLLTVAFAAGISLRAATTDYVLLGD